MPRVTRARLQRLGNRITESVGPAEDLGQALERIASEDFVCAELFSETARHMADHPEADILQAEPFLKFLDRAALLRAHRP